MADHYISLNAVFSLIKNKIDLKKKTCSRCTYNTDLWLVCLWWRIGKEKSCVVDLETGNEIKFDFKIFILFTGFARNAPSGVTESTEIALSQLVYPVSHTLALSEWGTVPRNLDSQHSALIIR